MVDSKVWISPDKIIKKEILNVGNFGNKPTENSICTIEISNVVCNLEQMQSEYIIVDSSNYPLKVTIGDANNALDRELEKCLQTMYIDESCSVVINLASVEISFELKLCHLESRGYIYEWDAKEKCDIAQKHKDKGVQLFKDARYIDASHRFSRGLKLLLFIPIPVEDPPSAIDGVTLADIDSAKANLFNNLASCYFKTKSFDIVTDLCTKVLDIDSHNVKALHKRGFAYAENKNYERAQVDLLKVLEMEPGNLAAKEKLQFVNLNINKQEADYTSIVKKMFRF